VRDRRPCGDEEQQEAEETGDHGHMPV
jgi:hypothetical protein